MKYKKRKKKDPRYLDKKPPEIKKYSSKIYNNVITLLYQ